MRKLPLIFGLVLLLGVGLYQQNPHGEKLKFDCSDCHTSEGWTFSASTAVFSHDSTNFILEGQHRFTDCKACHLTLIFSSVKTNCLDCHTDMHNNTVGLDCARCHNSTSWLVSNITEIHQMSRFPLLGAHNMADCAACHTSVSLLEFQPLGVECIDCHRQDYDATTNPNHAQAGLLTGCFECHKIDAYTWSSLGFNHDFFPLAKGHKINDCAICHNSGVFEPISSDCYSCHQADYASASNPSHQNSGFTTQCTDCHSTDPGWSPAKFDVHDQFYFPIYSGEHRGEWENCSECHTQPESYSVFSCTNCHDHNQNEMDSEHRGINGYSYNSVACYACHPLGKKEGAFNHDETGFILKGAHAGIATSCYLCHEGNYTNTPNNCFGCHSSDYNSTTEPSHTTAQFPTNCEACHSETEWEPSTFKHDGQYFPIYSGRHNGEWNSCSDCHTQLTNFSVFSCITCHEHIQKETDSHHEDVSDYVYTATSCYDCHPTGTAEDD